MRVKVFLMTDQENKEPSAEIIQGPWSKTKRKVQLPDQDAIELQENIAFAEEFTRSVIVQMIHTMGENRINVGEKDFIRDVGLLIEFTKGTIYRSMGLPHVTQKIFESFVEVTVEPDNNIHSEVDLELLMKFFELCEKNNNDE